MAQITTQDDRLFVAAVCGKQVRIYEPLAPNATSRNLVQTLDFPHYGAAKLYADEYEDAQRSNKPRSY